MPVDLYNLSIPVYIRGLKNLSGILKKAQTYADEKGIPHEKFINAKLADDMYPLSSQVQRVSDTAKGMPPRVGGVPPLPLEDNEKTFEELQARIHKTIEYLEAVDPAVINGREEAEVVLKNPNHEIKFKGESFMLVFALPNFFFHVTAAYAILRHEGVPVGKFDYLGPAV